MKRTSKDIQDFYNKKIKKIKELEEAKICKKRTVKKIKEDKDKVKRVSNRLNKIKLAKLLNLSTNPEFLNYVSYKELGSFAYYKKLITIEEVSNNYISEITTIKRYLHTLIDDENLQQEINNFVEVNSKLYSIGSFIINSFILWMFQKQNDITDDFIKNLLDDNNLKYMVIPFKNILKVGSGRVSTGCQFTKFNEFWEIYEDYFMEFYPTIEELRLYYSDQVLNDIIKTFKTNFKVHILSHFTDYFSKYIIELIKINFDLIDNQVKINETTYKILENKKLNIMIFKYKLYDFIEKGSSSKYLNDIPKNIRDFIVNQKNSIKLETVKLNNKMENDESKEKEDTLKVDITVFKKFYEMSKFFEVNNIKSFSMFPIYNLGRKHIFIDQKVIDKVFKKFNKSLTELFNLTDKKWNEINKLIRKIKRKKNKKNRSRIGCLPKNRVIKSISTDGIGISITCHIKPIDYLNLHNEYEFTGNEKLIGFDDGRVNLYQSAEYSKTLGKYETTRLTANKYQNKSLIIRNRENYLNYIDEHPTIKNLIEEMSTKSWRTTLLNKFFEMLNIIKNNITTLTNHYINNNYYSKWKMLLWRKKKAIMSNYYVDTIKKCQNDKPNELIVIALGDAKFASTGQRFLEKERHGGVPTNSKHQILIKVLKSMKKKFRILNIDEYNTSQKCYKCEHQLADIKDATGNIIRGLKKCTTCTTEKNFFKLRNRDLNAAINILKIGFNKINGLERPSYLQRPS